MKSCARKKRESPTENPSFCIKAQKADRFFAAPITPANNNLADTSQSTTINQARNQGGRSPLITFFAPPGKMCWTSLKTIGHSSKNLDPSQKTLRPSWCPKLVTGLPSMLIQSIVSVRVAKSLEIFSRTFCFSRDTVDYFHGCPQRRQNVCLLLPGNWD